MNIKPTFYGFCGAGGTGKTSTAHRLLEMLPDYKAMLSVSRSVFERFGVAREQDQDLMTPEQRWALQKNIQVAHREHQDLHKEELMICDRTQLDQFCYALLQCSQVLTLKEEEWLHGLVTTSMKLYKKVFYFPLVTFGNHDDNMRDVRYGMRYHFDTLMHGSFHRFGIRPIVVPLMSIEERAAYIKSVIQNSD